MKKKLKFGLIGYENYSKGTRNMLFNDCQTTSDAIKVEMNIDFSNKLPIDGEDYGDNESRSFIKSTESCWERFVKWFEKPITFDF